MSDLMSISEVRKVSELLETGSITDAEIEDKISDATTTVWNRVGEVYETPIAASDCPDDLKLCIKLLAASALIFKRYISSPEALAVAKDLRAEAFGNLKGIVETQKRRFANLPKQTVEEINPNKFVSVTQSIDTAVSTFRAGLNKYR